MTDFLAMITSILYINMSALNECFIYVFHNTVKIFIPQGSSATVIFPVDIHYNCIAV